MATEQEALPEVGLSKTDINWDRLDKTKFHVIGAVLFSAQAALLHPITVVKTRMQVASNGLSQTNGFYVFRKILKNDGIPGLFRGYGTSAIGSMPGRVLCLSALEMSKDYVLKSTVNVDLPEATRTAVANAAAGMVSSLISGVYYVPLDVVCQRLMVQGMPGTTKFNGALDATSKIFKTEGIRGLYRGFGMTVVSYSPASALWWGAYGFSQHMIWRGLGYGDDLEKKSPSHGEIVMVQATAGTLAGAASSILTTPLDTIKTRLQVMDNYEGRPSVMKTSRQLLKEDGWKGFYRGFGPRFLNMSLWGTSMIVTYELITLYKGHVFKASTSLKAKKFQKKNLERSEESLEDKMTSRMGSIVVMSMMMVLLMMASQSHGQAGVGFVNSNGLNGIGNGNGINGGVLGNGGALNQPVSPFVTQQQQPFVDTMAFSSSPPLNHISIIFFTLSVFVLYYFHVL